MKKKALVLILVLAMTLSLAACGGGESGDNGGATGGGDQPVSIIWGNYGNSSMPPALSDYEAIAYIEEQSGGMIKYDYIPDAVLGGEADMMQQIMDGTIQCTTVPTSTFSTYTDLLDCIQLPFLITSYEDEQIALGSPEAQALFDEMERYGVKIVAFYENGIRHFANNVRPITSVRDLAGIKLRIVPSNMLTDAMTMLGASPVSVPYTEVYSALQNNVVDGEEINITSIYSMNHFEVLDYISEIGMYPFPNLVVYNLNFWNSLTEEQQQLITAGHALGTQVCYEKHLPEYEAMAIEACLNAGIEINVIDGAAKQEFVEAVKPLWDEYRTIDPRVDAFITMAEGLQ